MGANDISCSSSDCENGSSSNETQVVLHVYDLTPINHYTYWFGLGIFHSAIEVHGKEYGFGAHDFPVSGVFEVEPKTCPGFIYRRSIKLGCTKMSPPEFRTFIETAASEYHGDTYHLLSKNCNHFTDDISYRLIGKHIPGWVNRLARLGVLCSCLLPESIQVTTTKQLPEYLECTEDVMESLSISTTTPGESTQVYDTEQEKLLPSPSGRHLEVSFVKDNQK